MAALFLKQSSGATVMFGPFVDATGAALTGLSITAAEVQIAKHGSSSFVSKNSGGLTHAANGYYYGTFDSTDTNTAGRLQGYVLDGTTFHMPVPFDFMVLPANVADSWYLGTDVLQVDVTQIAGSTAAGTNLSIGAQSTIYGIAVTGTLTTAAFTVSGLSTNITLSDRLIGRTVTFYGSASIAGEQAVILDYTRATDTTGTITVSTGSTPMSNAPANNDTFFIS